MRLVGYRISTAGILLSAPNICSNYHSMGPLKKVPTTSEHEAHFAFEPKKIDLQVLQEEGKCLGLGTKIRKRNKCKKEQDTDRGSIGDVVVPT